MKNIGLKTRLILAIGFLTLLMIVIASIGYKGMLDAEHALASSYAEQVVPLLNLKNVSDSYAVTIVGASGKLADDTMSWREGRDAVVAARAQADRDWRSYIESNLSPEEKPVTAEAVALGVPLRAAMDRLLGLLQKEDREALKAFQAAELHQAIDPFHAKLAQLAEIQRKEVADKVAANERDDGSLKNELLISAGLAVALSVVLGYFLVRMAGDLAALIKQVQTAGLQVNTSVTEIAATAREQQATANEIAATTTEIGATSKEISATSNEHR